MPTTHGSTHGKSTTRKSASAGKGKSTARKTSTGAPRSNDALNLLKADHRKVEQLFGQFEKARDDGRREQTARQICMELKIHTQIEEEIFYPACRELLEDDEIVNESLVEHRAAKDLIEQIEGMTVTDEMLDAKMKVLQEQIEHHVQEEEKELFPQLQKTEMDGKQLGQQLKMRKEGLMEEMGGDMRATH